MPIVDKLAMDRPPTVNFHEYDSKNDGVDDLNAWAIKHFTPIFSEESPAFKLDDNGGLHYFTGVDFNSIAIPDGWYIVLTSSGAILPMDPDHFRATYVEVTE